MPIPLIAKAAVASQALPVAAGLVARGRLSVPRRAVMGWCALLLIIDAVAYVVARTHGRNLWIGQVFAPLEASVLLWTLSYWQIWPLARTTFRAAIPLYLVVWMVLFVTIEDRATFSTVVEPIYMILGLLGAAFTLVSRSATGNEPLHRQDWFWVGCGLALYFGGNAALSPLGAMLVERRPDIVMRALIVKCASDICAFLTLTLGILCPPPAPSGASSSPPSSA